MLIYTHLEDSINRLYKMIGISEPNELDKLLIAKRLGIEIVYRKTTFRLDDEIVLSHDTTQREWVKFAHELCHYLIHFGQQLAMHYLFRQLQEYQSARFAYHFCVPTFMLQKLNNPNAYEVAALFNVEYEFAVRRLEMYKNKILITKGII